jgi:hypothetical protein
MAAPMNRRRFVQGSLLSSAALAAGLPSGATAQTQAPASPPAPAGSLPRAKVGNLEISRIILGGNLLTHYTHSRDLRYVYNLAARYNTEEKILETMAIAEAQGINTLSIHNPPAAITLLKRYRRERGGKMQYIICPTAPVEPGLVKFRQDVEDLLKAGATAIYVWGVTADALINQDRVDLLAQAVDMVKGMGVLCGVGGHCLDVVKACEKHGVKNDFYIKTFHHHKYPTGPRPDELGAPYSEYPGYWCREPEETAEFMKTVTKPWFAFKVMAAGAIPPEDAFRYAFSNGADCVLAGMFDFEIAEDVKIAREVLASLGQRARPWQA